MDIGIDGLPLFKASSRLQLWPIMGNFSKNKNVRPFLIGCFVGRSHPSSSIIFLKNFVDEVKLLQNHGILVGISEKKIKFKVVLFIFDAPAKSFITEVMGYASWLGCTKCCQIGKKYYRGSVVYSVTCGVKRTDDNFKNRSDKQYHHNEFLNKKTALEEIGVDMVSQIPIDPMHLLNLGVVKKNVVHNDSWKNVWAKDKYF